MTTQKPVTEQDINNTKHTLELLAKQVRSGRVEEDFAIRQIEKVKELLDKLAAQQAAAKGEGRFEALYNVTRMLGTSLDLQRVLDQVMDAVIKLTGAERGFLMLRDDDGNLKVEAARNLDQQTLSSTEFEYSRTVSNHVLDTGESILTTNAVEDPRFKGGQSIMSQALRSIMATPLRARGRIIGLAYVENRIITGLFKDEDLTTLETLTGQASIAIDNAILFAETDEALSKRLDELRELRRIDQKLNEKLDVDVAMQFTLETACTLSGATEGHLGLIQGEPRHIMATHHYDHSKHTSTKETPVQLDKVYPRAWEAVKNHETILFDTGQYGLLTAMIVPIMREQNAIGVMVLLREDGNTFSDDQRDLVERVVTRAAVSIENSRLYAAVQAADKAKSEFVGIVAHDLKAPMTSIRGYSDLMSMQSNNLDDRQLKFLSRITNTVNRMEILVSDLADISRIESGQFLMDEMRVTVESVVEAVRDTVMPEMQNRKHTYLENIEENLPDMWVDYYRLLQVLINILSNAYKYTPEGGTIILTVRHENNRIHFAIKDSGIGLTKDQIALLGTKFWRAEDDYTRSQPGTGLGYSITRSLVEQMGSKIDIESVVDKGSTFSFSVKTAAAHDEKTAAQKKAQAES
jgi:K+-sensing histidine kinase KdpD